ncbi:hypothetical protein Tco_0785066 [Tanacetum coccineum]
MSNNLQTNTISALHNAIMKAGGKDRPPMLAPGNYVQRKSQIKRYIDTKPNRELIHYCIEKEPYQYQEIVISATPGIVDAPPTRFNILVPSILLFDITSSRNKYKMVLSKCILSE